MVASTSEVNIDQQLIQLIKTENPGSVQLLANLAKERLKIDRDVALAHITRLIDAGKIKLQEPSEPVPLNLGSFVFSKAAYWFWAAIVFVCVTVLVVFTVSADAFPLVYVRQVLSLIFVLWMPGYVFMKALFPVEVPVKMSSKDLDVIERVALSLGMSLALVPMVGLLLNYTPWGIQLTPVTLSLLALTLVFAVVALFRGQQLAKRAKTQTGGSR
jgi:hypothetical protein